MNQQHGNAAINTSAPMPDLLFQVLSNHEEEGLVFSPAKAGCHDSDGVRRRQPDQIPPAEIFSQDMHYPGQNEWSPGIEAVYTIVVRERANPVPVRIQRIESCLSGIGGRNSPAKSDPVEILIKGGYKFTESIIEKIPFMVLPDDPIMKHGQIHKSPSFGFLSYLFLSKKQ